MHAASRENQSILLLMYIFWVMLAGLFFWSLAWFGVSLRIKRADIADIAWGPSFLYYTAIMGFIGGVTPRQWTLLQWGFVTLAVLWAGRLSLHVWFRFLKSNEEDRRYAKWRQEWGNTFFWRSYLQVFLLQGLISWVIVSPLIRLIFAPPTHAGWGGLGLSVAAVGLLIEALADAQLSAFKTSKSFDSAREPRILREGLWAWSRHPNYFGEVLFWWGISIAAFWTGPWTPAFVGAALLLFLILRVSGVTMMEKQWANRSEYQNYLAEVSPFVLWPPKKRG